MHPRDPAAAVGSSAHNWRQTRLEMTVGGLWPPQAKPAETPPQAATRVATKIKVEDTVHIMQA